ncbi:N-acetylmuramoyl-L-alanine amidase [Acinetobacter baumannii]|nr:N-acetylmuramoyl-L-alanine amidase [Acinetobacter baumannii]MDX7905357.1 N-acetylmuramoyl-L-alanine amidase [Acinetobacter baumannii]MDX7925102.1 N-acetylmuramoyl-L-alanine amidase [Acinetobacter baumannii]
MSKTITITAGHSNTDPGAVNGSDRESDIAQDMRNIVAFYLRSKGINIKTDGEGKGNAPLREAVKLINGSAIAVEFHCNAGPKTAKGVEALSQPKDKLISQKLCSAVASVMGNVLRGDKGWKPENSGQHSRLAYVQNGGIILELFFISNDEELSIWKDRKWLIGKAVAEVLANYAA